MLTALGWFLGLASGVRHAFEPDHLAAVSTLVADRASARRTVTFATLWGLGHAAVLVLFGGVLLAVRASVPAAVERALELAVALMLVVLGLRAIRAAVLRARGHAPQGGHAHTSLRTPLFVGVVHGLAGTGALTALAVTTLPSWPMGVLFMTVYGAGATFGMALLAGALGLPLARLARSPRGALVLQAAAGVLSAGLGVGWGLAHW
jgi:hypothetical protein